jgi:WD40 repeat protein
VCRFRRMGACWRRGVMDKTIKLWSTTATQSVPAGQVHTAPRSTPALQSAPSSQPSGYAPTPPPTPTPAQASRRRYGAWVWVWVWSVLAILLIGLCVINLLPDDSPVRTLKGHPSKRVVFAGWAFAGVGKFDKTIKLWRVADGSLKCAPSRGTQMLVWSVSFSPDGSLLASGSWDDTIKLWRVADGSLVRTLKGYLGFVFSVSFSPNGSLLASGSVDSTIKLWQVADGALR